VQVLRNPVIYIHIVIYILETDHLDVNSVVRGLQPMALLLPIDGYTRVRNHLSVKCVVKLSLLVVV